MLHLYRPWSCSLHCRGQVSTAGPHILSSGDVQHTDGVYASNHRRDLSDRDNLKLYVRYEHMLLCGYQIEPTESVPDAMHSVLRHQ